MSSSEQTIADRLMILIGEEKPYRWASKHGLAKGTLHGVLNKGANIRSDQLAKICKATSVSADWLLTGEGQMYVEDHMQHAQEEMIKAVFLGDQDAAKRRQKSLKDLGKLITAAKEEGRMMAQEDGLGLGESFELLAKIHNSGNQVLISAINANLRAFGESIDNKSAAEQLIKQSVHLEQRLAALETRLKAIEGKDSDSSEVDNGEQSHKVA